MTDEPTFDPTDFDPADIVDIMDCHAAAIIQPAIAEHLRMRARSSAALAKELLKTAADARCSAADAEREADNFERLANAIENARISFQAAP